MPEPASDRTRLEAIRRHAHDSLRYYATAYLRESDEYRDWMRAYLDPSANYMALLEIESADARTMLEAREEIANRYLEEAKREPWSPPCSFCGESPTVAWFEGPDFKTSVETAEKVRAEEAWPTCSICRSLVEADDRDALARRGMERWRHRHGGPEPDPPNLELMVRTGQERFWDPRSR